MKIAVTGHRVEEFDPEQARLTNWWLKSVMEEYMTPEDTAISGMATGADTWWAWAALESGQRLEAHVPFMCQAERWSVSDRRVWERILWYADLIKVYGPSYDVRHLFQRNDGMIAEADRMLAVWNGKETGGTYHCFGNWRKTGKPWARYNPSDNTVEYSDNW